MEFGVVRVDFYALQFVFFLQGKNFYAPEFIFMISFLQ